MFEISIEKEKKHDGDNKKKEVASHIKYLMEDLGRACEATFGILEKGELDKEVENKIIDIAASLKGSKKALGEILSKYSDVPAETRKEVEKRADAFLEGLEGKKDDDFEVVELKKEK